MPSIPWLKVYHGTGPELNLAESASRSGLLSTIRKKFPLVQNPLANTPDYAYPFRNRTGLFTSTHPETAETYAKSVGRNGHVWSTLIDPNKFLNLGELARSGWTDSLATAKDYPVAYKMIKELGHGDLLLYQLGEAQNNKSLRQVYRQFLQKLRPFDGATTAPKMPSPGGPLPSPDDAFIISHPERYQFSKESQQRFPLLCKAASGFRVASDDLPGYVSSCMAATSTDQAFRQGFRNALLEMAGQTKSAVNWRVPIQTVVDPLRREELRMLGKKLVQRVGKGPDPMAVFYAGYGRLAQENALRKGMSKTLQAISDPVARRELAKKMQPQINQHWEEIGAAAEPWQKAVDVGVPAAGVGAAAGLGGYHLGNWQGRNTENEHLRTNLADAPIMERLKYLIAPRQMV
jgi:hypothetical protein